MDLKKLEQLDLNLLKVLDVMMKERNLTRCAQRLHITPSAVSHALKRLRGSVGDELFVRQGQVMVPTPACERLAPKVSDALTSLKQALLAWQVFDANSSDAHFFVAMRESLEPSLLPPFLAQLSVNAPNVQVSSVALDRVNMERLLEKGDIHFAIDVAKPVSTGIGHCHYMTDDFVVLGWKQTYYSLPLTSENYLSARHIVVSSRPKGATVDEIALANAGGSRNIIMRCQSYSAAAASLTSKLGVLTLPKTIAEPLAEQYGLSLDKLPLTVPAVENHLYWNVQSIFDPAQAWFKAQLLSLLKKT